MPSNGVGGGSPSTVAQSRVNARCTVVQDTRCERATSSTERFSPTASATAWRSRVVVRAPGAIDGTWSVNVFCGHCSARQRHRVLCHNIFTAAGPYGRSFGAVAVCAFTDVDRSPQAEHSPAHLSSVTT